MKQLRATEYIAVAGNEADDGTHAAGGAGQGVQRDPAVGFACGLGRHVGNEATTGIPRHVAIIMDGNGRWAQARALPRTAGHSAGIETVRRVVRAASERGIECLTLYAFSTENWRRPALEVTTLWELLARFLVCERGELRECGIRLWAIGRRDRLPTATRRVLEATERMTAGGDRMQVRLALDYGARWAIAETARALAARAAAGALDPEKLDAESFENQLQELAGPPAPALDLMIRTGGDMRISNFLLWESAYAELWFTPVLWPDFSVDDFAGALGDFAARRRRFGGLDPRRQDTTPQAPGTELHAGNEEPATVAPRRA
jgi:undecaprenyl diphosphate synthase